MDFQFKGFTGLSIKDLYQILQLRAEVFIVEQDCVYNDIDGFDFEAVHQFLKKEGKIIAYSRILKPGTRFPIASIGRVVVHADFRKLEIGKKMMEEAIQFILSEWGEDTIKVSAQEYLQKFYEGLGFKVNTKGYLEDGIPHVGMTYKSQ